MDEDVEGVTAITGSANVGPETVHHVSSKELHVLHELKPKLEARVEVDYASAMSESEVLRPRHKRVTSGYNSDYELNLSVDDIDAEIKRLSEETAKMERHLAVMSGHSSCESGHSLNDMEIQDRFKYVTDRDRGRRLLSQSSPTVSQDRHHPGHQPTAGRQPSLVRHLADRQPTTVRHHVNTCSSATSPVRHHPVRQHANVCSPTASSVHQPSLCASTNPPVHQRSHTAQHSSSAPVRRHNPRRQLLYSVHEVDSESEAESSVSEKSSAHMCAQNKAVKHHKSSESGSDVDKLATTRTVSVSADTRDKAVKLNVASQSVATSDESSSCVSVACEQCSNCSSGNKQKQSKCVVSSGCDDPELKSGRKKFVSGKSTVSAEACSDKKKANVVKSSEKCSRSRKSSVHSESESEADDKSCAVSKRRVLIKPDKFDGVTPTFATFRAHFDNASKFNEWDENEQLAFLKSSLTGSAAQCLWDQSPECSDTLEKLWKMLSDRFAGQNVTEKYRTELRNYRRKPGESLDTLCQNIRRLLIYGYPGPTSSAHEAIAKDSFIDALSSELSLKVRERDPPTLDAALHIALRLEAVQQAAAAREVNDDNGRAKGRARAVTSDSNKSSSDAVLSKLKEIESKLDSDRKTFSERLNNVESAIRSQQSSNGQQRATPSGHRSTPGTRSTSVQPQSNPPVGARYQQQQTSAPITNPQSAPQRVCFLCGDPTHFMRQCPTAMDAGRTGQQQSPVSNNNSWYSGHGFNQQNGPNVATTRGLRGQLDNGHVYLVVHLDGKRHLALLDSGCELSLAPNIMLDKQRIRPSQQCVFAANGSPIQILGEADIEFDIGGRMSCATVLVTPDVSELMLGITWLTERQGVWDFNNRMLHVDGLSVPLHSKKTAATCRRVYVQDDIVVAPRQQVSVPARSTIDNVSVSESNDWLLETKQLRPGVLVARTLLPDQHRGIAVRVVNTSPEPQELRRDTCLGSIEAVEVCDQSGECNSSVPSDAPLAESAPSEVDPVTEMLQSLPDELSVEQRETAATLLRRYEDVFSKGEFDVGCTRLIEHHIDTGQHRPVRQALRRHPTAYLDAIDEYVEQLRQQDMIEPSGGPWCSNIVVVRRKDGRLRLCVDYRGLNARTYYDSYPLPNIEATLEALGGSSWFCTLDLRSGYHNVVIADGDRDKTQFITRRGTFRWKRMPFGLSTAPGTFQRLMDLVMCGLSYESVLVYLDDLIIMASSFEQLVDRFAVVLDRLRVANLKLNCRKCNLFQRKVSFLGHIVSEAGIEVQPEKTEVVSNWPVPANLSELRSFLGLASYYRRFINSFSIIAAPLFLLMRKGQHFCWNDEQQEAFDELKRRLTTAPVLASPRSSGTLYLDTDASETGLGIVLSQEQDGLERVLSYASRSLNKAERNYSITRKELLAVIFGLKRFRQHLIGRKFVIRTDHSALQWLRRTPEPIAQAGRWLAIMEEFSFEVQHRAGAKHQNADALSRYPPYPEDDSTFIGGDAATRAVRRGVEEDPDFRVKPESSTRAPETESDPVGQQVWHVHAPAELAEMQGDDPDVGPIVKLRLEYNDQPPFETVRDQSTTTKIYWSQWPRLVVREGVVYRTVFDRRGKPEGLQLLVPTCLRSELIEFVHCGLTGSHVGFAKTVHHLLRRGWWRGCRGDVRRQLRRCSRCSRYHRGTLPRQGPLQPTRVGAVFERLSIDLTGPHPRSRRGHIYILTVVCPFSKFCECIPLRNKEAVTVARALVEEVFCRYGTPLALLSDRGGEVDGQIMKEVCRLLQIDKLRTSSYHPACNAACERMHRTLNSLLGKVVSDRQNDWDDHLPYVAAALRASPSEATGYSPNFLMYGREVNTPADIAYGLLPPESEPCYDDFVEEVRNKMVTAHDVVRDKLRIAAARNKRYYDLRVKYVPFKVGDLVFYYNPRKYAGRSEKWARKYTGPFRIVKELSPVTMLLQAQRGRKTFVSHVDKLKRCDEGEVEFESQDNRFEIGVECSPVSDVSDLRPRRDARPPKRLITEC